VIIDVDPDSAVPAFEQVRAQLSQMIRTGVLPPGFRLAPIRQLAADLALAPGTVARVYRELEAEGLVVSRVRHGTVVAHLSARERTDPRVAVAEPARSYAAIAARFGLSVEDAIAAVREEWGAVEVPGGPDRST
jgi:GntR family transcriptional regulator